MGSPRPQKQGNLLQLALKTLENSNKHGALGREKQAARRYEWTSPLEEQMRGIIERSTLSEEEKMKQVLKAVNDALDSATKNPYGFSARQPIENVRNILTRPQPKLETTSEQQVNPPQVSPLPPQVSPSPQANPPPQSPPSTETAKTTKFETDPKLARLDSQYISARAIADAWTTSKSIPQITIKEEEKEAVNAQLLKVKELEQHLKETYKEDFSSGGFVWHGFTSLQRILWQDEKFRTLMSNPNFVKAMMLNAQNKSEVQLLGSPNITLSGLVLSSLAANQISYLATAAPNWINKPKVEGVQWDLINMNVAKSETEIPHQVTPKYLDEMHAALTATQTALQSIQGNTPLPSPIVIPNTDSATLLSGIEKVVSDEKSAAILCAGAAGASTQLNSMIQQSLEVMGHYKQLLEKHDGDHSKVLGYGLVSHAMDAKHLIAAMHSLNPSYQGALSQKQKEGQEFLQGLIAQIKSGEAPPALESLLKIRFQQVATNIEANKNKLAEASKATKTSDAPAPEASKKTKTGTIKRIIKHDLMDNFKQLLDRATSAIQANPQVVTTPQSQVIPSKKASEEKESKAQETQTTPEADAAKAQKRNPKKDAQKLKAEFTELFLKIEPKDFDNLKFTAPNLVNMSRKFDELSHEIMNNFKRNADNPEATKRDFDYYLALLDECKKQNNFYGAMAIYSAIDNSDLNKQLRAYRNESKALRILADSRELFTPMGNFKNLRKAEREAKGPIIPTFPVIMKDLTNVGEHLGSDSVESVISGAKGWDALIESFVDLQKRAGKPIGDYQTKEMEVGKARLGIKDNPTAIKVYEELLQTEASFGNFLNMIKSQEILSKYPNKVPEGVLTKEEAAEFLAKFDAVKTAQQALAEALKYPDPKKWTQAIRDANKAFAEYGLAFNKLFLDQHKAFPPKIAQHFAMDPKNQQKLLGDIFIMPVQRGGRYELLGREFLKALKGVDDNNEMKKAFKEFYKDMKLFQFEVTKSIDGGTYTHIADFGSDKLTSIERTSALTDPNGFGIKVPQHWVAAKATPTAPQADQSKIGQVRASAPKAQDAAAPVPKAQDAAPQAQVVAPQAQNAVPQAPNVPPQPKSAASKAQDAALKAPAPDAAPKSKLSRLLNLKTKVLAQTKIAATTNQLTQDEISQYIQLKKETEEAKSKINAYEARIPKPSEFTKEGSYEKALNGWHDTHIKLIDKFNEASTKMSHLQSAHPEIAKKANVQIAHLDYLNNKFIEKYNKASSKMQGAAEQEEMRKQLKEYERHPNAQISKAAKDVSEKLFGLKSKIETTPPSLSTPSATAPSTTPSTITAAPQASQPHIINPSVTGPARAAAVDTLIATLEALLQPHMDFSDRERTKAYMRQCFENAITPEIVKAAQNAIPDRFLKVAGVNEAFAAVVTNYEAKVKELSEKRVDPISPARATQAASASHLTQSNDPQKPSASPPPVPPRTYPKKPGG